MPDHHGIAQVNAPALSPVWWSGWY